MKKVILPIVLYGVIMIAFMQNWLLLAAAAVFAFSFRYGAVTLIPMAVLLDAYFGHYGGVPYLSLGAVLWYVGVEQLRPKVGNLRFLKV